MEKTYKDMTTKELRQMFRGDLPLTESEIKAAAKQEDQPVEEVRDVTVPDGSENGFTYRNVPRSMSFHDVLKIALKDGITNYDEVSKYGDLSALPYVREYAPQGIKNREHLGKKFDEVVNFVAPAAQFAGRAYDETLGLIGDVPVVGEPTAAFVAGTGRGLSNILEGVSQTFYDTFGLDDQSAGKIADYHTSGISELDKYKQKYPIITKSGEIFGGAAPFLVSPSGVIPLAAIGAGAGYTAYQPSQSEAERERERVKTSVVGALLGGALPVGYGATKATAGGVKPAIGTLSKVVNDLSTDKTLKQNAGVLSELYTTPIAKAANYIEDVLDENVVTSLMRPNTPDKVAKRREEILSPLTGAEGSAQAAKSIKDTSLGYVKSYEPFRTPPHSITGDVSKYAYKPNIIADLLTSVATKTPIPVSLVTKKILGTKPVVDKRVELRQHDKMQMPLVDDTITDDSIVRALLLGEAVD